MSLRLLHSEVNYERNEEGECVLSPGATSLGHNTTCSGLGTWYERTAYRKGSSVCEGGIRLDRGSMHSCSAEDVLTPTSEASPAAKKRHGLMFWTVVSYLFVTVMILVGYGIKRAYRASTG